jgi:hypothetical protein
MEHTRMTKEEALDYFMSHLGLAAYQENAVPSGELKPQYPYLTYEVATDSWDGVLPIAVNLWYRSTSWVAANEMAQAVSDMITRGGITLPCDGGMLWITRGQPFARSMGDGGDDMVKRKVLNLMVEFLTED